MTLTVSKSKRGQFFSADAIIAAVIFIMGLSILTAQWFSVRAQADAQANYLLDDAHRVSDLLLNAGSPLDWYVNPAAANSSGFGQFGTRVGILNQSAMRSAMGYINADQTANLGRYNQTKQLLSVSSEFYVQINVSCLNSGAPAYPSSGANGFPLIAIGSEPMKPTQVSRVVRDIVIPVSSGITNPPVYYYYGTMTVTMWTNKSTI